MAGNDHFLLNLEVFFPLKMGCVLKHLCAYVLWVSVVVCSLIMMLCRQESLN